MRCELAASKVDGVRGERPSVHAPAQRGNCHYISALFFLYILPRAGRRIPRPTSLLRLRFRRPLALQALREPPLARTLVSCVPSWLSALALRISRLDLS